MSDPEQNPPPRQWFEPASGGSWEDDLAEEPTAATGAGGTEATAPKISPYAASADQTLPIVDLYQPADYGVEPSPYEVGPSPYGAGQQWSPGPVAPQYPGAPQYPIAPQNPVAGGAPGPYGSAPYPSRQPYGWGPVGYPAPDHPQATTVLVLGALGVALPMVSFAAWYMGGKAKAEIERGAPFSYSGSLKAGHILGKVVSILSLVGGGIYVVAVIISMLMMLGMMAI